MQLDLFEFLMGSAVIAAAGMLVYRYTKGGMWAAGYWWSERDRRRGPG